MYPHQLFCIYIPTLILIQKLRALNTERMLMHAKPSIDVRPPFSSPIRGVTRASLKFSLVLHEYDQTAM